jgi:light-regulated signal transduction histidine kinase (bacteriophytochrome)
VTTGLQLLERAQKEYLGTDAHEHARFIGDSEDRMKNLIKGLLRYSRGGSGGETFHKVDSEKVLTESLLNLDSARKGGGALVTHDELPTMEHDCTQDFSKIFLVFQQLDRQEKNRGTGIGLAIVKSVIERHGPRIWVESEVGVGSTLPFTMPVREVVKP